MTDERHRRAVWACVAAAALALLVVISGPSSSRSAVRVIGSAEGAEAEADPEADLPPAGPAQTAPPSRSSASTTGNADVAPPSPDNAFGPAEDQLNSGQPNSSEAIGPEGVSAPPIGSGEQTVLRLIYFVEADQEFDPRAVEAIERQAEALQIFWYEQFGGTFRLPAAGVDVVYGDHPADFYDRTPDGDDERWYRLMNIRAEVTEKLGLPSAAADTRTITFPNARIDGRVGANRHEGAWMDGDDISCIDDIVDTTPYTPDFPANCLGTVAHELGHVYGLGHQGIDEDCMQFGFYHYVNGDTLCDFSPENRAIVIADPLNAAWLDAEPGDRAAP